MEQILEVKYQKKPAYNIIFTQDFEQLPEKLESFQLQNKKIVVFTDSNVVKLHASKLLHILNSISTQVFIFTFPAGENNKTLDTVRDAYKFLIQHHFDRNDLLVAFGGGVVGDLCGYTAATYLRGVSFIQIPTTLLSQVDSSIGGKTGVDFEGYKNMVGAFYMPKLVYMNLSLLETLPEREFHSGMAEVLKYGFIKDVHFFEWLISNIYEIHEKDSNVLTEMIVNCCKIKKQVVEKDPLEKGERALLNFGHTLGHAIEKYKNFELLHGECVSLGIVCAAHISMQKQYISSDEFYEIRDMLVPFDLPISITKVDIDEIINLSKSDKKMDEGKIKFILLKKIGSAFIDDTVTENEMRLALEEINYSNEDDKE
jgi:3-dehydroquinate synthase